MIYYLDPIYDSFNLAKIEITQKSQSRMGNSPTKAEVNQHFGIQFRATADFYHYTMVLQVKSINYLEEDFRRKPPDSISEVPCSDDQCAYQEQGSPRGKKKFDPLPFLKLLRVLKTMKNSKKEILKLNYFLLTS